MVTSSLTWFCPTNFKAENSTAFLALVLGQKQPKAAPVADFPGSMICEETSRMWTRSLDEDLERLAGAMTGPCRVNELA